MPALPCLQAQALISSISSRWWGWGDAATSTRTSTVAGGLQELQLAATHLCLCHASSTDSNQLKLSADLVKGHAVQWEELVAREERMGLLDEAEERKLQPASVLAEWVMQSQRVLGEFDALPPGRTLHGCHSTPPTLHCQAGRRQRAAAVAAAAAAALPATVRSAHAPAAWP